MQQPPVIQGPGNNLPHKPDGGLGQDLMKGVEIKLAEATAMAQKESKEWRAETSAHLDAIAASWSPSPFIIGVCILGTFVATVGLCALLVAAVAWGASWAKRS